MQHLLFSTDLASIEEKKATGLEGAKEPTSGEISYESLTMSFRLLSKWKTVKIEVN